MKKINTLILLVFVLSISSFLASCSDDKNEDKREDKSEKQSSGDHVWKQQTDALQSAKEIAKKAQESLEQQQQKIDESN